MKSQNKFASFEEYRALKEKLMNETQLGYTNQILPQNISKQKSLLAVNDYGDAPDLNWAGQFGGSGNDYADAVVSDENGNIFITGSFSGQISVSGNNYVATGEKEAYVAKFDITGSFVWLTQIPATENNKTYCHDICMDADGNLYVTGYYTGAITVGESSLPDINEYSLFYAKLDPEGNLVNGAYHSQDENEIGLFIDTDNNGNIYITCSRSTSTHSRHMSWILKYDQSTNLIWEMPHDEGFNDIIVYGSNIYYTGVSQHGDDGYIDANVSYTPPAGYHDIFIAKSDLDGNFIWLKIAEHVTPGFGSDSFEGYFDTDGNGNFYMAGEFRVDLIFDNDTIYDPTAGSIGFISKFDEDGNFMWVGLCGKYPEITNDSDGNSFIASDNVLTKFNSSGVEQWSVELNNYPSHITISSSDKLVTSGSIDGLIFVSQLDNNANEEWLVQFEGNSASSYVIGMVTDNTGKVYIYGCTSNTIDYFGEEVNKGVFICKQNGSGEVIWLKQFEEVQMPYGSQGNYLNIDTLTSHIYITGELYDELIIPGEITLTPAEGGSVFILKYDLDGNYVWHVQEDFNGNEPSVVPDQSGNVILSGTFDDIITIGNTELESLGSSADGFVAKYDENGTFLWAIRAGGESIEYMAITSTDASDNIYLSGEFLSENVTVDDYSITLEEGDGNIIFAKLNSDGNVLWVTSHAGSPIGNDWKCWPTGIKTDAEGYTYMKGWHGDLVYFDDIVLTSPYGYGYSYFIAKFDPDGNTVWANSITEHTYGFDYNQFDIDSEGSVYFGAQIRDTVHFGYEFIYVNVGNIDLFVTKYTTAGELDWVKIMQGNESSYNWISSVAVYDTLNVFVGGFFGNYLSIDDDELTSTNRHGFVTMFGDDISGIKEVYNRNNKQFDVYPNPSNGLVTFTSNFKLNNKIEILNVTGQIVHTVNITSKKQQIDLRNLSKGLYFIKVSSDKIFKIEKLIIE